MHVVEGEDNPTARTERFEKRAHGTMGPEALVVQPARTTGTKPVDAGHDGCKLLGLRADPCA